MRLISKTMLLLVMCFCITKPFHLAAQNTAVKVMSYNVWNGFDWGKELDRKAKTVAWIAQMQPDVLALQELCGYTEEMLSEDAKKWGHSYSILLKTTGYPVGLTSNKPIVLKEKAIDNFWHGMLHCETYGIDFFAVHFSPFDYGFRHKEAGLIIDRVDQLAKDSDYIILGDFNALSPFDAEYLEENNALKENYRGQKSDKGYSNLQNMEFDYSVISRFLGIQTVDVCLYNIKPENRFTFPTPALRDASKNLEEFTKRRVRIDYILTSPNLARQCTQAEIFNGEETSELSDHFPVMATFNRP